jgi:hypothetical protein
MHFSGRQLLRMEGDATREIALCLLFGVQFLNADGHLHRIRHYGLFANGKNRAPQYRSCSPTARRAAKYSAA